MIHRGLLFWSVVAVATAVGLFGVKYKVQDLEERIDHTNQKIVESQQATHILKIEWAHLNEAERIEHLANAHLNLEQASIKQVVRLDSLKTQPGQNQAVQNQSVPPRRDSPLPSPPRTGNDVPSSTLPGGGRVAAEAGSPSPASAPPSGRSTGPTTPPRPALAEAPAPSGPGKTGRGAAVTIDDILARNEGERR